MDLPSSMAETNKGEIGLYSRNDKKILGGTTCQKSQKEMHNP